MVLIIRINARPQHLQTLVQPHMPEIMTFLKHTLSKHSQRPRGCEVLQPAVAEGITPNLFETVWQLNSSDAIAILEFSFPDHLQSTPFLEHDFT